MIFHPHLPPCNIQKLNSFRISINLIHYVKFITCGARSVLVTVDILLGLGLTVNSLGFGHETVFKLDNRLCLLCDPVLPNGLPLVI